jgi:hypothetical protein
MKMIAIMFSALLITRLCIAPTLSHPTQIDKVKQAQTEIKRVEVNKQLSLFIEHLGLRESNNQWKIINQINCMGKYQFHPNTLKHLGYGHITPSAFRQNPDIFPEELQDRVLLALLKSNEIILKEHFSFIGKEINGIIITKSGIMAAAHLGGARSVMLFLESNGQIDAHDINQTSIRDYLREFSMYNI